MKPLAVNAEMTFTDMPFYDRVKCISDLGFRVGLWSIQHLDVDRLAALGAEYSMIDGFGRGNLVFPDAADTMIASIEELIPRAKAIGSPIMNLHGAKLSSAGRAAEPIYGVTAAMVITAQSTLRRIAELGERHDMDFSIENLNPFDHPGVPLNRACDILALIKSVDSPRVRLNLDLYHAQRDGGNLIALLKDCRASVAEVQIADVPDRDMAGGGEIHYANIAHAMSDIGYQCSVGLEAWAHGDSRPALERYKSIFADFHGPSTGARDRRDGVNGGKAE